MAARARTASRSPTRRSVSRRPRVSAPSVDLDSRSGSSPVMGGRKSRSDRPLFKNPFVLPLYTTLALLTVVFGATYALLVLAEAHGWLGKLFCPCLRKWMLGPLGMIGLKSRGIAILCLALYSVTTWIVLTIASAISIPLTHGVATDLAMPRLQKASLGGLSHRLSAAQSNMIEGLVMLLASLTAASWAALPDLQVAQYTGLFVVIRMVYCICYAMDWPRARSCTFMMGTAICCRLLHLAALKFL